MASNFPYDVVSVILNQAQLPIDTYLAMRTQYHITPKKVRIDADFKMKMDHMITRRVSGLARYKRLYDETHGFMFAMPMDKIIRRTDPNTTVEMDITEKYGIPQYKFTVVRFGASNVFTYTTFAGHWYNLHSGERVDEYL